MLIWRKGVEVPKIRALAEILLASGRKRRS